MDRRAVLAALLVGLLVGLLPGCATVPTSGPVQEGGRQGYDPQESYVRVLAQPPARGAAPQEVVLGFLRASADFQDEHRVARGHLTSDAGFRWQPLAGVAVLAGADSRPAVVKAEGDRVTLRARQVAEIDAEGHYRPLPEPRDLEVPFRLRQEAGEWRIAELPDGLFLPRYEVDRVYRQVNLYYLTPGQDRLVPDPVLLPAEQSLATELTKRLLAGPGATLSPAATTAFPAGTKLAVNSVPVEDGVARVDLTGEALTAPAPEREAMSAQLVWTLQQHPLVREVAITVDTAPFEVPDAQSPQPADAWAGYDPAVLPEGARPHLVVDGRVGYLEGGNFVPLKGGAGEGRLALRSPAVSPDGRRVAALSDDGRRLYGGAVGEGEALTERKEAARGAVFGALSFDSSGTLWTVERGADRDVVWAFPPPDASRPVQVALPDLAEARVAALRISRDGSRLAVILRTGRKESALYVGVVARREGPVRVTSLQPVAPDLVDVRDVAWTDADSLAVLGAGSDRVLQPHLVSVDGLTLERLSPLPDAVAIAAAPHDAPLLLGTAEGSIFAASGPNWQRRADGRYPFYPG